MSKLDKEFKKEVNEVTRMGTYVGWKIGIRILLVIIVIGVLGTIGNVAYKKYTTEKNREIFKESVSYNETAAGFLADSYKQYVDAPDESEKKAIMKYVTMRYPNLDTDEIENDILKQFYNKCLLGGN